MCTVFTSSTHGGEGVLAIVSPTADFCSLFPAMITPPSLSLTFHVTASSSHSATPAAWTVPGAGPCQALSPPALEMQAVEHGQNNNNNTTINQRNNHRIPHIPAGMAAKPSASLQNRIKRNQSVGQELPQTSSGKTRR